ncbi:MAG TPA: DUF2145 domain-containing protein [Solimonas sp.]|nr:DUF2145 domain-containing protein [Solimonas sp.]
MRAWCVVLMLAAAPAWAGQTCQDKPVTPEAMTQAVRLAQQVQLALGRQQAHAAILGRIGSDVSDQGLRWTHAGLAYLDPVEQRWTILHKLNHCGKADSALYRQGLANFFLDDPYEYRALLLVPGAGLQDELLRAAQDGQSADAVNQPSYSLLAYPFATDYQNSNGWLLEFIAEATGRVHGRRPAQDYLRATGYQPDFVRVGAMERLGASLFKANVSFFDHPLGERLRGRYAIVSVESIERWLRARGNVQTSREVSVQG